MPVYTVEAALLKNEVPDGKYGPMKSVTLTLRAVDSDQVVTAEWFTKAATPIPVPGSTLEGTIEQSDYGTKFKKIKPADVNFGGGGGRSENPATQRSISMQHAQKCAVDALRVAAERGEYTPPPKVSDLASHIKMVALVLWKQVQDAYDNNLTA